MMIYTKQQLYDFLSEPRKEYFDDVAASLFDNFCISKKETDRNGTRQVYYRFKEIEFYLYDKYDSMPDCTTLNRDCKAGQWFFHKYGVDIAFETKTEDGRPEELSVFGGILIRGVERVTDGSSYVISGPQRCISEIFNSSASLPRICEISECPSLDAGQKCSILKAGRVIGKSWPAVYGGNLYHRYYAAATMWEDRRPQICEIKDKEGSYHVVIKDAPYKYKDRPLDNDIKIR